jgi:ADP-ribose pyrophosphatase YjhB (NUDIX family)
MVRITAGERVGKQGRLGVGTSAAVFDDSRQRILLIHRTDNGEWAVPGGYMEPGESLTEGCEREVLEETGLRVKVKRLVSVNSDPHILLEYPDGNRWQLVVLHFEAERIGGSLSRSDESSEVAYFTQAETAGLAMNSLNRLRIDDSFAGQAAAVIRDSF